MCECILRELSDLNPGVLIEEWTPDSSRMRQLVVLMHKSLFSIREFRDGIYKLPRRNLRDFCLGPPSSIDFDAVRNARYAAREIAVNISTSGSWGSMMRESDHNPETERLSLKASRNKVLNERYAVVMMRLRHCCDAVLTFGICLGSFFSLELSLYRLYVAEPLDPYLTVQQLLVPIQLTLQ